MLFHPTNAVYVFLSGLDLFGRPPEYYTSSQLAHRFTCLSIEWLFTIPIKSYIYIYTHVFAI